MINLPLFFIARPLWFFIGYLLARWKIRRDKKREERWQKYCNEVDQRVRNFKRD